MIRVGAYIDGFNLYHGLKAAYGRKYLWLDLHALVSSLLKADQSLEKVRYFTARVRNDPAAERRQAAYLDALTTHTPSVEIIEGQFQQKMNRCRVCDSQWIAYEEKETDVNIAVSLVEDAVENRFDTALLISADSDLCPGVRALRRLHPDKKVVAAFPPRRRSDKLRQAVDGAFTIGTAKIRNAQLPVEIDTPAGIPLLKPDYWL